MDLNDYRLQLDAIDTQMKELFIKRMDISKDIARYKLANGLAVFDASREAQVLETRSAGTGEYQELVKKYFQTLMDLSKEVQKDVVDGEK